MTPKPSDPNRMRELGRVGGKASAEARRKRKVRSLLDVWKVRADADPEELYDALKESPAGAVVIARILEKAGILAPEQAPAADSEPPPAGPAAGFANVLLTVIEAGQEVAILGFELTESQRESVRARASSSPWAASRRGARDVGRESDVEADGGGERGSPVSSSIPLLSPRSQSANDY